MMDSEKIILTPPDIEQVAHTIVEVLGKRSVGIDCPLDLKRRMEDHEWVLSRRKKEAERTRFWEQMYLHAAKWGMVSVLTALFYGLWLALKQGLVK